MTTQEAVLWETLSLTPGLQNNTLNTHDGKERSYKNDQKLPAENLQAKMCPQQQISSPQQIDQTGFVNSSLTLNMLTGFAKSTEDVMILFEGFSSECLYFQISFILLVLNETCSTLLPRANPFKLCMAMRASSQLVIVTNPKPLHFCVWKSLITFTLCTAPNGPNSCHRTFSSVSGAKLYTNIHQPAPVIALFGVDVVDGRRVLVPSKLLSRGEYL